MVRDRERYQLLGIADVISGSDDGSPVGDTMLLRWCLLQI